MLIASLCEAGRVSTSAFPLSLPLSGSESDFTATSGLFLTVSTTGRASGFGGAGVVSVWGSSVEELSGLRGDRSRDSAGGVDGSLRSGEEEAEDAGVAIKSLSAASAGSLRASASAVAFAAAC